MLINIRHVYCMHMCNRRVCKILFSRGTATQLYTRFPLRADAQSRCTAHARWGVHRAAKRNARADGTKIQRANIRRTLGIRDILFLRLLRRKESGVRGADVSGHGCITWRKTINPGRETDHREKEISFRKNRSAEQWTDSVPSKVTTTEL